MKAEFKIKHLPPHTHVLQVSNDLTVQWSNLFKEQLLQLQEMAMEKRKPFEIVISLERITTIDVSALQLLHVFRKLMETTDRPVAIVPPELPSLMELIERSGWSHVLSFQK